MKIAIFSDTFPPQVNGVANVVKNLATHLANHGHKIYVVTVAKGFKKFKTIKKEENYTLINVPSVPAMIYHGYRLALPNNWLLRYFKKNIPDIIHTHTPFLVGWEAVQLAKTLGCPLVGTHHTFYDQYLKHIKLDFAWTKKWSWKYTTKYYNRCELVISPSQSLAKTLQNHQLQKPLKIIPNPINQLFFQPPPSLLRKKQLKNKLGITGKSLVYMGRVSFEKNIEKIIKALPLIKNKIPDINLVIIGDGPEKKRLQKLTKDLGMQKHILFTGFLYQQELIDTLQANEIFVTASTSENMPLSVLEAMAVGLPVVAVKALGMPEIVEDRHNGLLTDTDNENELAEKILKLLTTEDLLKKYALSSAQLAQKYTQQKAILEHEKIYQQIIDKKL
ncbi:MAG: hypothetical protein A2233_01705 [Candidatus Kerfeldbacteria bacterium RIFOXYA2_FULL_38_24]|uniref:Glycosyl transferase family 1 n=1 Tax=Candidatus Kerfeldbacteria bacterium RIFOXYB2_FULL_38_14 TaxID=1798547 RepID=A0A1G2BG19_9BACT|nr:MAG: hypothetical protein A2319_04315 [Candidatus Kerfeldbacteria bacterium RIFOXYB2_FULL_38_14]OGY87834.1 MAG: hypothetical protein A2233_01705 [Candidatus Kerfeldbacteria bacterium RIFOXYA2_FULL_38_24]OGY90537.1 MAG: hypothetical protein A2458_02110 [Candidatus Kerfeldbacteria bacterium RIFOXYC2_FULL_38_9]